MGSIVVRRPISNDRDELHRLFDVTIRRAFEREEAGDALDEIGEQICHKQALIDEDYDTSGADRYFLVATLGSKIVGTVCHGPCSDIIKACADRDVNGLHEIGSMYILPEYQGKGIGKILLNAMYLVLLSKNIEEFCLDSGYDTAKRIWRKLLGAPSLVMKDYWAQGVDHHIWFRKLDEVSVEYKI